MRNALIIEDVPQTQQWLAKLLVDSFPGITVEAADTVAGGNALIRKREHDIALVDLGLPDGSGVECLITRSVCWPDKPSIVSTSFEDDEHLFLALQAGASGYILKDQRDDEIIALLQGISQGNPPLSPVIAQKIMAHFVGNYPKPSTPSVPETITPSEVEVLTLISKGLTVPETAELLGKTRNTVSTQLKSVYSKLNVSSRAEVTRLAVEWGIL